MVKKRRIHAENGVIQNCKTSVALLLLHRELGGGIHVIPPTAAAAARSRRDARQQLLESTLHLIDLQCSFNSHDPSLASSFAASYMRAPSAVSEMALQGGLLFVLLQSGLCPVYDTHAGHRFIGYLNQSADEVIRSVIVNKHDNSVISVHSLLTSDSTELLRCTSTPAQRGSFTPRPATPASSRCCCSAGRPILEVVDGGGWLEFDDTCSRALLLNAQSMLYKVYDMTSNYRLLFTLPATNTAEIKLGHKLLLLLTTPLPKPPGTTAATAATPAAGPPEAAAAAADDDDDGGGLLSCTQGVQQLGASASAAAAAAGGGGCCSTVAVGNGFEDIGSGGRGGSGGGGDAAGEAGEDAALWWRGGSKWSRSQSSAPRLQVYAAANGQRLAEHDLLLPHHRNQASGCPFDVIELCGDKLLLKLPLRPFEVYEVPSMRLLGCSTHEHLSGVSGFIDLAPQRLFMTVCGHTLTTWNFKAEMVSQFQDHELWYPSLDNSNTLDIGEQWVVALCRAKGAATTLPSVNEPASIHISSLATGRLLAAVSAAAAAVGSRSSDLAAAAAGGVCDDDEDEEGLEEGNGSWDRGISSSPNKRRATALTDITSLLFVEGTNCIYSGTQQGLVHVWAPGRADT